MFAFGTSSAFAAFHGIAVAKSCTSPTKIGAPYTCQGSVLNTVDQGGDTIEVTGASDTVNASGGSVATGNILASTGLVFGGTGTVTCTGHTSGDGSPGNPWLGATDCFLTFGATITTVPFSHYTVQPGDFNIPSVTTLKSAASAGDTTIALTQAAAAVPGNTVVIDPTGANPETRVVTSVFNSAPGVIPVVHTLSFATPLGFAHLAGVNVNQFAHHVTDTLNWNWNNTCTFDPSGDCTTTPQMETAGASTLVQQLNSTTSTSIHNASHAVVTSVEAGSVVHDFVTVSGQPGLPNPSGSVTIDWFTNGTCSGEGPAATSGSETLDANGQVDATNFSQGPLAPGSYSFEAHYGGDGTYLPSVGACEPLQAVDANISITPNGVNRVGQAHTFTAHVNVNDGTGFVNAPAGTQVSFTIDSGPGSFTTTNPCTTVGTTGSCTITLSSGVTGVTTVSAHVTLAVDGLVLTRNTNGTGGNSGPATKRWVNAAIAIAPSATNEIGHSHTFIVTVTQDTGTGTFVALPGATVAVTLTDSNGAAHTAPTGTCFMSTTDANGQCTVIFTSNSTGSVTAHATTSVSVAGSAAFSIATDGNAPNSGDAVKTFVDANIQISPATANNPVSTNHTLTAHVNINGGPGFANALPGTPITFTLTNSGGATAAFVGPSSCTTVGATGSCTVVISSSTVGTTTVKASTTVTVGGVVLTRTTGDAKAGDSADASKTWADVAVTTTILNAAGTAVTSVPSGTVVHDTVAVTRASATPASVPNPTGTVIFHRFTTADCTGSSTDQSVALTPGNPSTAASADFATAAPTANGALSYKADYSGDANYPARSGACEPLTIQVAPAPAIAIVKNPKGQTVPVGGTAKFTITVTNVGNTVLTNVTVTDPLSPDCDRTSAQIPALATMNPGAAVTYTCSRANVRAPFTNVATATGTPPSGPNVTASDSAPVKVKPLPPKKFVPKKHPKVVSHKRPKATG